MTGLVLTVGISDCVTSRDPGAVIATHALGSCIAVAIYDPAVQVAGLLHFMLPESGADRAKAQSRPFMYADTGLPLLCTHGSGKRPHTGRARPRGAGDSAKGGRAAAEREEGWSSTWRLT